MDAYISKPIRSRELFEAIDSVLEGGVAQTVSAQPVPGKKKQEGAEAPFDEVLLLSRTDGSHELCTLLIDTFCQEYPTRVAALRQALQQRDSTGLARAAHALKGAVATFTNGVALQATVTLEKIALEGDLYGADEAYERLVTELDRMQVALTAFADCQRGLKSKGQTAN
jgi:HPt (histidine-containing phosphotransfer) domain-containing protein